VPSTCKWCTRPSEPRDFPPLLAGFFQLPTEMRLAVYSHCTAFTLLQLSHSSTFFYAEINKWPRIIESSVGFRWCTLLHKPAGRLANNGGIRVNHSIMYVEILCEEERKLFRQLYCRDHGRLRSGRAVRSLPRARLPTSHEHPEPTYYGCDNFNCDQPLKNGLFLYSCCGSIFRPSIALDTPVLDKDLVCLPCMFDNLWGKYFKPQG
jgi:hypothetical protein